MKIGGLMPEMEVVHQKIRSEMFSFEGLNRREVISDKEIAEGYNLSAEDFPALTCRLPREKETVISNPHALFSVEDKLAYVSGTQFFYNGVSRGTVTAGKKSMVDFNGRIIIMPDRKYYDYIDNKFGNIGSGTYPASGSCPQMDFITTHMNRIFGVKGDNVYATKLGEYNVWTYFEPDELASWGADVYSDGDFTAITNYQNHVVMFKEDKLYELYGATPSQFQIQEIGKIGCIDNKSIQEVAGQLFFLGREGVYAYGGGLPRPMSLPLNETYLGGTAGTDGRRYYLSLKTPRGYRLYTYDTWAGVWYPEDNLQVIDFTNIEGMVYALTIEGDIIKFNSGEEEIEWEAVTKAFTENSFIKKGYTKINMRADFEKGSSLEIYVSIDNGSFRKVRTYRSEDFRTFRITLPIKRADHFTIKFKGKGKVIIHGLEKVLYAKGGGD